MLTMLAHDPYKKKNLPLYRVHTLSSLLRW